MWPFGHKTFQSRMSHCPSCHVWQDLAALKLRGISISNEPLPVLPRQDGKYNHAMS